MCTALHCTAAAYIASYPGINLTALTYIVQEQDKWTAEVSDSGREYKV